MLGAGGRVRLSSVNPNQSLKCSHRRLVLLSLSFNLVLGRLIFGFGSPLRRLRLRWRLDRGLFLSQRVFQNQNPNQSPKWKKRLPLLPLPRRRRHHQLQWYLQAMTRKRLR